MTGPKSHVATGRAQEPSGNSAAMAKTALTEQLGLLAQLRRGEAVHTFDLEAATQTIEAALGEMASEACQAEDLLGPHAYDAKAVPTPQPNLRLDDFSLIAELSVFDLVFRAEDPLAHSGLAGTAFATPTVELGIQSVDGQFTKLWSEQLGPENCECLADFFRVLAERTREARCS